MEILYSITVDLKRCDCALTAVNHVCKQMSRLNLFTQRIFLILVVHAHLRTTYVHPWIFDKFSC